MIKRMSRTPSKGGQSRKAIKELPQLPADRNENTKVHINTKIIKYRNTKCRNTTNKMKKKSRSEP